MFQRHGLHADSAVFVDHFMLARVDRMKDDVVQAVSAVVVQQRSQQFLQIRMRIDVHRLRAFEHRERRQQTYQAETMVSVQMGDEDVIQSSRPQTQFLHRQQHSFAAVDQERLVAQIQPLPGRGSGLGRLGTAAT